MTIDVQIPKVLSTLTPVKVLRKPTEGRKQCGETSNLPQTKVYFRRWLMLAIFILYAIAGISQWLQYSIISNIVSRYYGVSLTTVDWTSLVFLVVYIPTVFPATYLIDRWGLRWTMIIGCAIFTLGSWIKVFSASPDKFYVTFIGQVVVSVAQVFVVSVPGRLAANWFGANQISTATAVGLFGCQLGITTNFLLPPNIVRNHENLEDVGRDLFTLYLTTAIFTSVVFATVVLFIKSEPPLPPSETRRLQKQFEADRNEGFSTLIKRLLTNRSYIALWHGFGVTIGVFNALGTLINQMYLIHFQNAEVEVGQIGVISTLTGMVSSVLAGIILDKTHKFKLMISLVCALSWMGITLVGVGLIVEYKWLVFVGAIIFGFFNGGYSTIGFEVCAEFTYPDSEGVTTAFLTVAHQLYGAVMILVFGKIIEISGDIWVHIGLAIIGFTGLLAHVLTKNIHKRYDARENAERADISLQEQNPQDTIRY